MEQFTEGRMAYLRSQRLGRLATIDFHGAPQTTRVPFGVQADGSVVIGGRALGSTRKFKNAQQNPVAALVIDDLASVDP